MLAVRQHVLLGVDWPDVNTGYRHRVPVLGNKAVPVPGTWYRVRDYVAVSM